MVDAQLDLLGRFEVRVDGRQVADGAWTRRSASALVKLLALAPERSLHREQVLDALWPDLPPGDARPRLHTAAHYARRALGDPAALMLRGEVFALFPGGADVDVARFARLARAATDSGAADDVDAALAAYGGPLLPDDLFEPWTAVDRDRLRQLHIDVLRAGRRWDDVLREEPADEQAHLELMRAAEARGDRRGALRQYERLERALRSELGVVPGPEARALRDRLLPAGGSGGVAPLPRLVGRRPVLQRLDAALREARAGRGRTVLVSGGAGAGTSAVLAWVRARALGAGARVGAGAASAAEGGWPYAPVLEGVADLCRRHPALLAELDEAYRREIERALRGGELSWSGEGGHQRLFVAVADLLRLAADGTGAVLTVDDLTEADEASLRLLHYLARSTLADPVLLVAGSRTAVPGTRLATLRASLLRRQAALDLPLPPLPVAGTAALLAERLGAAPAADVVRQVHALSTGRPGRVLELASSVDGPEPWRISVSTVLAGCPRGTDDALRRLVVAGGTGTTDEFVALSGVDEDTAFEMLDAGLAAGVIETAEVGFAVRDGLLPDAVLADLPPHRVQRLHREVAAALESVHASPARIARHLLQAGAADEAVPHLLRAAESAAAVGAYRDALALVDEASGAATGKDRVRLLGLRADLLLAVGDPGSVAAYRAAAEAADGDDRRALLARLAQAASMDGDPDTAEEALMGLEPDGGPADGSILLARGVVAYFRGDLEAAQAAADGLRGRTSGGSDWRLLELITLQGMIAHDRGEWFRRLRHELQRTRKAPALATSVFDAHLCVAEYLLYGPTPYPEVLALGRALRETAERAGARRAVAFARALIGEAALLSGDVATAEAELTAAVDLHADIGAAAGEAHALQRLAEVRVLQGERTEARRLLARALPRARWSPIAMHLVQRIAGTEIAAAESPAAAHAAAEAAEAVTTPQDRCLFCRIMVEVPSVIACADVGDLDGARRHLREAEFSASLWHGTAWQAALQEARAHLARAEGDHAGAARLLAAAAAGFEAAGQPLDAARCRSAAAVPSVPEPRAAEETAPAARS